MNKAEADEKNQALQEQLYLQKSQEVYDILNDLELGERTPGQDSWIVVETKMKIYTYLNTYSTIPQISPPESISYELVNKFLKRFHNTNINAQYFDTKGEILEKSTRLRDNYIIYNTIKKKNPLKELNYYPFLPNDYKALEYLRRLEKYEKNGKFGYKSKHGTVAIYARFDSIWQINNGYFMTKLDDKFGYINKRFYEIIPPKYDDVGSFFDNIARVKLNGKWGYINLAGKEVIPLIYDKASISADSTVYVEKGFHRYIINHNYGYYKSG